jgi:hypothetical protein
LPHERLGAPPALHGPCWQWTRKIGGKTVTRLVPDDQLDDYRQWLDNHRRLRTLVTEFEALTLAIAHADPRARRRPAVPAPDTRQTTTSTLWLSRSPWMMCRAPGQRAGHGPEPGAGLGECSGGGR